MKFKASTDAFAFAKRIVWRGIVEGFDDDGILVQAQRCDHRHKHQDTALNCAKSMLRTEDERRAEYGQAHLTLDG